MHIHDPDLDKLDYQAQGMPIIRKTKQTGTNDDSIMVPITLQNKNIMALLDTGASTSAINIDYVKANKLSVVPYTEHMGDIILAVKNMKIPRIGKVEHLKIEHNNKTVHHTFEVMPLSENTQVVIGLDLMPKVGTAISGLATSWLKLTKTQEDPVVPDHENDIPNNSPVGTQEEQNKFMEYIQPLLKENAMIPKSSFCTVPESVVELKTPEGVTSYTVYTKYLSRSR